MCKLSNLAGKVNCVLVNFGGKILIFSLWFWFIDDDDDDSMVYHILLEWIVLQLDFEFVDFRVGIWNLNYKEQVVFYELLNVKFSFYDNLCQTLALQGLVSWSS